MSNNADFDRAMLITRIAFISAGFIGNVVTFCVFSRATFAKNSISTYCRALAIFDCFTLFQLVVDVGLLFFNVLLPFQSSAMCKIYYYSSLGFSTISGWILVAFSFDKLLSVRRAQVALLKRVWFQWSLVAAIALFNFLLYIEVPIYVDLAPYKKFPILIVCDLANLSFYDALIVLYLIESALVPFVLMLGASIVIVRSIWMSRRSVERGAAGGKVDRVRRSRDTRFAISSMTFNVLYVAFKMPLTTVNIMNVYNLPVNDYFNQIAMLLFFANASTSILVHIGSNSLFRRELLALVRLDKSNAVGSNTNTSNPISRGTRGPAATTAVSQRNITTVTRQKTEQR